MKRRCSDAAVGAEVVVVRKHARSEGVQGVQVSACWVDWRTSGRVLAHSQSLSKRARRRLTADLESLESQSKAARARCAPAGFDEPDTKAADLPRLVA